MLGTLSPVVEVVVTEVVWAVAKGAVGWIVGAVMVDVDEGAAVVLAAEPHPTRIASPTRLINLVRIT